VIPTDELGEAKASAPFHEFAVDGGATRYQVVAGPEGDVAMIAVMDAGVQVAPHEALLQEYGDLTTLEVYLALAPADEPPNQLLIDAHAQEATANGREDLAVRQVAYQGGGVTEKGAEKDCKDYAASLVQKYPGGTIMNTTSWPLTNNLTAQGPQTNLSQALAICSPWNGTTKARFGWAYEWSGGWSLIWWFDWVTLGSYGRAALFRNQGAGRVIHYGAVDTTPYGAGNYTMYAGIAWSQKP
jgi:hypothetical protein